MALPKIKVVRDIPPAERLEAYEHRLWRPREAFFNRLPVYARSVNYGSIQESTNDLAINFTSVVREIVTDIVRRPDRPDESRSDIITTLLLNEQQKRKDLLSSVTSPQSKFQLPHVGVVLFGRGFADNLEVGANSAVNVFHHNQMTDIRELHETPPPPKLDPRIVNGLIDGLY